MNDKPTDSREALLPLLVAFDEGLAAGREPELTVPTELAEEFGAAQSVLRLLNQAWPRADSGEATLDHYDPAAPDRGPLGGEPSRLGRFRVVRRLGGGGFGVVYLADDPTLGRRVAVKVPRWDRWEAPEHRSRFLQEARAAAALDHPNIVRVHEADDAGPVVYIASAYCEGPSLADWLRARATPVPCRLAAALAADLASGVRHAHERGVLHRDLKPANVVLEGGAAGEAAALTPKICDFGLAKLIDAQATETASGAVMGTPQYMAPEQAEGRTRDIGPATDVYALGAILYELLAGRPPFEGATPLETARQVVAKPPAPPRRRRKDVPRDLETIVLTCLAKEPGRRYASAAALEGDLRLWLNGESPLGRPEPWPRRAGRWLRAKRAWAAAASLFVAAGAAAVLWRSLPSDPDLVPHRMAARLAQRQPVSLIGNHGGPAWRRWAAGGRGATDEVLPDGTFRINSGGCSLLELLPDPGRECYAVRAEIRHEKSTAFGYAGIYFARRECATPAGVVQAFVQMNYSDILSPSDLAAPDRAQMLPAGRLNQVFLAPRFWADDAYGPKKWSLYCGGRMPPLFQPAGFAGDQWRTLTIKITAADVRGLFADNLAVGDPIPVGELIQSTVDGLNRRKALVPDDATTDAVTPGYAPRGGIGLLVNEGTASFRNVTVEPLD